MARVTRGAAQAQNATKTILRGLRVMVRFLSWTVRHHRAPKVPKRCRFSSSPRQHLWIGRAREEQDPSQKKDRVVGNFSCRAGVTSGMKTQKALGLQALVYGNWRVPDFRVIQRAADLPETDERHFVRPCPVRPRHGFVESRVCATASEVRAVWDEARMSDPEAELILMPPIDAVCSAILAGGRLAIGPGNDGATAGHDVIELRVLPHDWDPYTLDNARIAKGDTAYLELVTGTVACNTRRTYAVQLRSGPELPASRDYVPDAVVVTRIVHPHDDLQRWEAEVPTFAAGTVVVAPNGSLASHAAVHCVLHGVPFVTSYVPAVGDTITPTADAATFVLRGNAFLQGAAHAERILKLGDTSDACQLAVLILHEWVALRSSDDQRASSLLLGFACRVLARVGAAICAGEARHYSLRLKRQRKSRISRSTRIASSLRASPTAQRRQLTLANKAFVSDGWRSGFGGKAWQECASAVDRLWRAQTVSLSETDLVAALNRVVNVAHNNGALLTKLVTQDYLNTAAADPTRQLIPHLGTIWEILTTQAPAVPQLPAGGKVKRPAAPTYNQLHVHTEPGGIKAHLWRDASSYVSNHVPCFDAAIMQWIAKQPHTSPSRANSGRMYVAIPLQAPIKSEASAILAAVTHAMAQAGSEAA